MGFESNGQQQHESHFGFPVLLDAPLAMDPFPGQGDSCASEQHRGFRELAQYLLCDSDSNSNVGEGDSIADTAKIL